LGHPFAGFLVSSSQPKGWLNWLQGGRLIYKRNKRKKKKDKAKQQIHGTLLRAKKKNNKKSLQKSIWHTHTTMDTPVFIRPKKWDENENRT
jgi:hypothetical protein